MFVASSTNSTAADVIPAPWASWTLPVTIPVSTWANALIAKTTSMGRGRRDIAVYLSISRDSKDYNINRNKKKVIEGKKKGRPE
jgi:hypothetical protein